MHCVGPIYRSQKYSTSINLVGENTFLILTSRQMTSAIVQLSVLPQGPGQNILMRTGLPQALHEATAESFNPLITLPLSHGPHRRGLELTGKVQEAWHGGDCTPCALSKHDVRTTHPDHA